MGSSSTGWRFRFRQYWQINLWMIPVIGAIIGILLAFSMAALDKSWDTLQRFDYAEGVAATFLSSLLTATVTFTGFTFTMLLLVPQFSGTQLSARVLQLLYRDIKLKLTLGTFIGTMLYILVVLSRMRGGFVPGLSLWFAGFLVVLSIMAFLAFVSHFIQNLRPATAASAIATTGRRILDDIYPDWYTAEPPPRVSLDDLRAMGPAFEFRWKGRSGVILAFDHRAMARVAEHTDCVLVLTLAVGDYLTSGDVIAEAYGAKVPPRDNVFDKMIALGPERTFEQDPSFALRVLVDIATKALSAAINDPTTASNVIDRIEDLLMVLITRDITMGRLHDAHGNLRVIVPTPTWDEYLAIAVTEIREYGFNSIQTVRRIRRMLEDLLDVAPAAYRPSLQAEISLLNESAKRGFPEDRDLELAGVLPLQRDIRRASSA